MNCLKKSLIIFLNFLVFSIYSQEVPPITVFSPEDYGAENQNWAITQASNKYIYVANNKGLLEYNGTNWRLYPTPNETILRSVKSFQDKIYCGFYRDFGFWKKNNLGVLEYTSIVEKKKIEMLEDEQIWEILELDNFMIFKSLQRIYIYDLKSEIVKIIKTSKNIIKIAKVENSIYFQELYKGVYMIENGTPKLISDNLVLKENKLVDIFLKNNKLHFLTQKEGFYFLENNELKKWEVASNSFLQNKTIYSSIQLHDESFILGSISNGMIYLSKDGNFKYQITKSLGLSNNTVLAVFEDVDRNIWLGLDNGINNVNMSSPFRFFVKKQDFWGTIYSSIIFNDNLYIGTNQGLFVRNSKSKSDFEFVKNTQGQVWDLHEIDNTLFCSHDSGTFIINGNIGKLLTNIEGTWGVKKIDNNTLLQGSYDGLYILTKENGEWKLRNKLAGFSNSSKYFEIIDGNYIFVNHEYKGVFKLKVNNDLTKIIESVRDTSVEKGLHSSIFTFNNSLFYASKNGIFKYSKEKKSFVLDKLYSSLISKDKFLTGKIIPDTKYNKLWSFSTNEIRFLSSGKLSNEPELTVIPLKGELHKSATGYENIINLSEKKYLIGTTDGFLIIDLNKITEPKDFSVTIDAVFKNSIDSDKKRVDLAGNIEFPNDENNFEFTFSVPNYSKTSTVEYQYQLEGLKENWTLLSKSNSVLLENLPAGDYVFKVRAYIDNKPSLNTATYQFSIKNPWYLQPPFLFVYFVIFGFMFYSIHVVTKRYYRKQREKLLVDAQKELELKELENSQKIIKLNNDKLRLDIENKNRELATSTMSIIKKNEFLNAIKTELISGGKNNLDKVIKIIDKNLNNTDDWKLFQEAFNNADKKFLKKIKSNHPDLTPNDLRLCAYLRLNLSSKEIAPLLNISPRSVEVKRYRLRKKMNLEHDANLISYIIEL
ncbi:triple tyrosine motif-containing protein [Polaribacter sp.]|uniref:triple tyrosine motif-containing protein n=1 Tax=Polaribacter sp. TaxID=1920175 RepID=UPI00404778AE